MQFDLSQYATDEVQEEVTASVYYLRDYNDSMFWRPLLYVLAVPEPLDEPGFPEAYEHVIDLAVSPFDPTKPAEAARAVFAQCQNLDGTKGWEPCDIEERSMDIGDVIILGDTAFRIMDQGPEEVVL